MRLIPQKSMTTPGNIISKQIYEILFKISIKVVRQLVVQTGPRTNRLD